MNATLRAVLNTPDDDLVSRLKGSLSDYANSDGDARERALALEARLEKIGELMEARVAAGVLADRKLSAREQALLDKAYAGIRKTKTERPEDGLMGEEWRESRLGEWGVIVTYEWRPAKLLKLASWGQLLQVCGLNAESLAVPLKPKVAALKVFRKAAAEELEATHAAARPLLESRYFKGGRILSKAPYLEWRDKKVPSETTRRRIGGGGTGENKEPGEWVTTTVYDEGFRSKQNKKRKKLLALRDECIDEHNALDQALALETLLRDYMKDLLAQVDVEPAFLDDAAPAFVAPASPDGLPHVRFRPVYVEVIEPGNGD